ncbi:transmembrane sensor [Bordetella ansorpii]|uniref:Transmembrane sensor n=1 Tax=Bordetella ansorpii TaxID=288768 RepID=A0A157SMW8_9BORD|nr:FecR domain-containing protein [Bordetella ansorpii]SAI71742.1 transmembrane sensor [Bordetella ansorpii]
MTSASCTSAPRPCVSSESGATPPMAGGQPISEATADAAAEWLTVMMSGEATEADHERWRQWRAADAEHERAWRHIEAVMAGRLGALQRHAAYQALSPYAGPAPRGRRQALRLLLWGGAAGGTAMLASRTQTWRSLSADYRTGTGEQRALALADGTRILLNTGSAIDVRFDGQTRLVRLIGGEVLITTGHPMADGAPDPRPFIVQTGEGRVRALGTRFTVRQDDGRTVVAVIESAVEVTPDAAPGQTRRLHAGERAAFTRHAVDTPLAMAERDLAWTRRQIVAEDVRLADFLAELGRYRPGLLRCDPAVADLRLSGVFPLEDTGRVLAMLPKVLPVQVRQRTRYWVTIEGRA